jgi:hypothetical protein
VAKVLDYASAQRRGLSDQEFFERASSIIVLTVGASVAVFIAFVAIVLLTQD